jgi:formylmethanofuran dehydrogenase subunit A
MVGLMFRRAGAKKAVAWAPAAARRPVDPVNGAAQRRDGVRDGRIVRCRREAFDRRSMQWLRGMAGGIDLHTHIGGGKVNLARLLMVEDHRDAGNPSPLPANPLELPSCGRCAPGTLATGYRYVEMGYTAAFEPAMVASNARHAHMEMGDVPVLDHGAYVMLGNDELFLQLLAEGGPDAKTSSASATTWPGPSTPPRRWV